MFAQRNLISLAGSRFCLNVISAAVCFWILVLCSFPASCDNTISLLRSLLFLTDTRHHSTAEVLSASAANRPPLSLSAPSGSWWLQLILCIPAKLWRALRRSTGVTPLWSPLVIKANFQFDAATSKLHNNHSQRRLREESESLARLQPCDADSLLQDLMFYSFH